MPCTEPESLGNDQTKSASPGAQAGGRKEEQLETSLAVQPDDMTGNSGTRSRTRWSKHKFRGKYFFQAERLGWTSKQHKSLLAIS